MAMHTAKPAAPKLAKPRTAASATAGSAESRPNSGSKPYGLLGHSVAPITAEIRRAMIAEAAYYIAEQRGFTSGRDLEDWLLAERQIEEALSA